MVQELSITEARQKLPKLVKAIQKDPDLAFAIKVHGETIARLSAAKQGVQPGKAVQALLGLIREVKKGGKEKRVTSKNFKDFLYR